jgi:hypothetical protein
MVDQQWHQCAENVGEKLGNAKYGSPILQMGSIVDSSTY